MEKKSEELTTQAQAPSDVAIVRGLHEVIAKSPMDIQRGQGAIVFISGAWLPGALLYLAGLSPLALNGYRGVRTFLAIDILVRQGQLEEGQRRFDDASHLPRRNPVAYFYCAGNLASHRGDYTSALSWWRQALPRAKGLAGELLKQSIGRALLLSGQHKEARLTIDGVSMPPQSDPLLTGDSLTRVMLVLYDPSAPVMPDEELHDRARAALAYSHTGVELAAIGWAFDRRGDTETARWLADEASQRMHYPYLATWWPALHEWLETSKTGSAT